MLRSILFAILFCAFGTIAATQLPDTPQSLRLHSDFTDKRDNATSPDQSSSETLLSESQQSLISSNALNASLVIISLALALAIVVFSTTNISSGDVKEEPPVSLSELQPGVELSGGGVPAYNRDGTLKSVKPHGWMPKKWELLGKEGGVERERGQQRVGIHLEMRFPAILLLVSALTALAIPLHARQEHAATISTETVPLLHGNATIAEPTGVVPEAKATGSVEAAAPPSGEAGKGPSEAAGAGEASSTAEEEAVEQEEITKNGFNAVYVVVSLVAIMAGCVFVSAAHGGTSEHEDDLRITKVDRKIILAHGGVPTYKADGTLASIKEFHWKPMRDGDMQGSVVELEEKEEPLVELQLQEAMHHTDGRVLILNDKKVNGEILTNMQALLKKWDSDKDVKVIAMLKRASVPVFCGGIQVTSPQEWQPILQQSALLAHQIATLNTPFVSIMDGPTHGLGASLSIHAPFRISTENSRCSFAEGPKGLGVLVPGTAFALRRLALDDFGGVGSPLAKYLAVVGEEVVGMENVLAGIATHHVPSDRISPLVARLCETKSSDLRFLDLAVEDFAASSPSVEDWANWSVGEEPLEVVYRCFQHNSLAGIIAALKKEKTPWSEKILALMYRNSPTVMELNIEAVNLAAEPMDLLTSFKNDLSMLRGVENSKDFQTALSLDSKAAAAAATETATSAKDIPVSILLDPQHASRDSWLASELEGATDPVVSNTQPRAVVDDGEVGEVQWSPSVDQHVAMTATGKKRVRWLKEGKWLENLGEEGVDDGVVGGSGEAGEGVQEVVGVKGEGKEVVEDGDSSMWIQRTFRTYAFRCVTGLPGVKDVEKVVKGEVAGSGDHAMTHDEVVHYFRENWNTFLDEERNLTPISASPVENWRIESDQLDPSESGEARIGFPSKYYDLDTVEDPSVGDHARYGTRRKEKWGLRQRIEYLVQTRCKVVSDLYLQWK
ncbi:hypothetical protein HDU98_001309 [Podochytrium sp. JEL0797]|nr:hypothetical protein HDU98_001309 [Podochytrium sp. JEL0797]